MVNLKLVTVNWPNFLLQVCVQRRRARAGQRDKVRAARGGLEGAVELPGGAVQVRAQFQVRGRPSGVRRGGRLRGRLGRGRGDGLQGPDVPKGAVPVRWDEVCYILSLLHSYDIFIQTYSVTDSDTT